MGKSTISMAIFNCYVSSPEGMLNYQRVDHRNIHRSVSSEHPTGRFGGSPSFHMRCSHATYTAMEDGDIQKPTRPGKRLHNYGKSSFFMGKINYFYGNFQ